MSHFNTTTRGSSQTVNRAGGVAYEQTNELKLASLLLTSFLKNQYYRSGKESQKEIVGLVQKVDPLFAAQAAVYARNVFGMRSVSHVVAGELVGLAKGKDWAKRFYSKVVFRPDDATEILAYVKGKVSHAMRKGLRTALERFDDYQIGKYKGEKKSVKLVDAVNIVHAHSPSITKLVKGELEAPETFETKLSKAGKADNADEAKTEAWRELLENRKIGYLALVRNLRNIMQQAPELVPVACELLQDEALIRKSKIFPFQYLTAYNEIGNNREMMKALTRAIDLSCKNVPKFDGKTLIAVDESGSMNGQPEQIASLFMAVMYKAMNADALLFDDDARWYAPNPDDSIVTIANGFRMRHGGTRFGAIFDAIQNKRYDRIFILSDMQAWMDNGYWGGGSIKQRFNDYRKAVNPEVKLYSFDLQGMGDMQFPEQNVYTVAGWSDKVFDVISKLESGQNLVQQIKQVEI